MFEFLKKLFNKNDESDETGYGESIDMPPVQTPEGPLEWRDQHGKLIDIMTEHGFQPAVKQRDCRDQHGRLIGIMTEHGFQPVDPDYEQRRSLSEVHAKLDEILSLLKEK